MRGAYVALILWTQQHIHVVHLPVWLPIHNGSISSGIVRIIFNNSRKVVLLFFWNGECVWFRPDHQFHPVSKDSLDACYKECSFERPTYLLACRVQVREVHMTRCEWSYMHLALTCPNSSLWKLVRYLGRFKAYNSIQIKLRQGWKKNPYGKLQASLIGYVEFMSLSCSEGHPSSY